MICGWLGAEVSGRYLGNFPIETSRGKSSQSFCTISAECSLFLWSRNISFENIFKNSMALSFSSTPGGSTGWWSSERDVGIQPSTAFSRTHREEDTRICRQPAGSPFWAICRYFREIVLFQWGKPHIHKNMLTTYLLTHCRPPVSSHQSFFQNVNYTTTPIMLPFQFRRQYFQDPWKLDWQQPAYDFFF